MSVLDTETPLFVGGGLSLAETPAADFTPEPSFQLASPFANGYASPDASERLGSELEFLVGELEDEGFAETVEALVDEVAGRHLASATRFWSPPQGETAELEAWTEAEAWTAGLAESVDGALAELESRYRDRRVDSVTPEEAEAAIAEFARDPDSASEQLLGGLVRKAVKVAGAVAKGAVSGLSKLLPMGQLFAALRRLVRPLLRRVLARALNRLPANLRGPAGQLAAKLGVSAHEVDEAPDLSTEFDTGFAEMLIGAPDTAPAELLDEVQPLTNPAVEDPLTRLDRARTLLTRQLAEAEPGRPPTEQLEQFIPAVMAAMPLIRTGVRIVGRDRVKRFLATQLALLIRGLVGPQAARALAPHVADAGLRLLSLEAESPEALGAEAMVDTLEETIASVASLPEEALEQPLRLEAEVGEAFAAAAVRHLPRELLRDDLAGYGTEDESATWVAMPRRGRLRRYRTCARRYDVAIAQPQARRIELPGEDTLEDRLLDAGVSSWPVGAEVHLFETTVGTHLGHLAAMEGEEVEPAEFEELSTVNAALLLGRPGLGTAGLAGRSPTGQRLFRLVIPGRKVIRRRRRVRLRLRIGQGKPELRVHVRLGERLAHQVAGLLARNQQAEIVGLAGRLFPEPVRRSIGQRLTRMLARALRSPVTPSRGEQLASHVVEAMLTTIAQQLPASGAALAAAAQAPAPGLTLTFAFSFTDRAALSGAQPGAPSLTIRPGAHYD